MAKVICILLGILLAFGGSVPASMPAERPAAAQPAAADEDTGARYRVRVMDQDGAPVKNAYLGFCTDSTCTLRTTDEDGRADYDGEAYAYHLQVIAVPAGYAIPEGTEAVFPAGGGSLEIRVVRE